MTLIRSSTVGQGDLVALRGKRLVLCGRRLKPFGVLEDGHNRITITLYEERIITPQPTGVVRHGTMEVKAGRQDGSSRKQTHQMP